MLDFILGCAWLAICIWVGATVIEIALAIFFSILGVIGEMINNIFKK